MEITRPTGGGCLRPHQEELPHHLGIGCRDTHPHPCGYVWASMWRTRHTGRHTTYPEQRGQPLIHDQQHVGLVRGSGGWGAGMAREPEQITAQRRELGSQLAAFRHAAGLTQEQLAGRVFVDRTTLAHLERGRGAGTPELWQALDTALDASGALARAYLDLEAARDQHTHQRRSKALSHAHAHANQLRHHTDSAAVGGVVAAGSDSAGVEAAWELARRVAASDVASETVTRLELAFDDLAMAYPLIPPETLLAAVSQHLGYVSTLLDRKATLAEHKRLVVVGGWLSLLAATVHIDLKQNRAATAHLHTAASLAQHAEHPEIRAWCYETEAWRVLTEGDYPRAVELSQAAQHHAPRASSVAIQAIAQEGRAWARLGQKHDTYNAINRVQRLVSPMARPDRPEHHYKYDPDKSVAYTATTLAWVGDPAAEHYARDIITRLQPVEDIGQWPRRVASANLDLALALLVTNRLDEACHATHQALASGRVVPSNHWRAAEIIQTIEQHGLPHARDLRNTYRQITDTNP